MISSFSINGLTADQSANVADFITRIELSWTMDAVSQLEFDVLDENILMLSHNYFQVRREVTYNGHVFEISAHEIKQSKGKGLIHTVECRTKAVQLMKRDKNPEAFGESSASDFVRMACARYGLVCLAQSTAVKRTIVKATGPEVDESVWDVIQRLAADAQFVAFESDGTLYFGSQEWLLGKWANVEVNWPSEDSHTLFMLEAPNCRRSDDDPNEMDF